MKRYLIYGFCLVFLFGCAFEKKEGLTQSELMQQISSEVEDQMTEAMKQKEFLNNLKAPLHKLATPIPSGYRVFLDEKTNVWMQYPGKAKIRLTKNGGRTNVCSGGGRMMYSNPILSRDVRYLLVIVTCDGGESEIYVKDISSLETKRIGFGKNARFNEDGSKIIIAEEIDNPFFTRSTIIADTGVTPEDVFIDPLPPLAFTETSCLQAGGDWKIWHSSYPDPSPECNLPTSDQGKICTDSRDCESYCHADPLVQSGIRAYGRCHGWLFVECIKEVSDMVVGEEWCE